MSAGRVQVASGQRDVAERSANIAGLGIDRQSDPKLTFGRGEIACCIFEESRIAKDAGVQWIELLCSGDGLTTFVEPANASGEARISRQDFGVAITEFKTAFIGPRGSTRIELAVKQDETQCRISFGKIRCQSDGGACRYDRAAVIFRDFRPRRIVVREDGQS